MEAIILIPISLIIRRLHWQWLLQIVLALDNGKDLRSRSIQEGKTARLPSRMMLLLSILSSTFILILFGMFLFIFLLGVFVSLRLHNLLNINILHCPTKHIRERERESFGQ